MRRLSVCFTWLGRCRDFKIKAIRTFISREAKRAKTGHRPPRWTQVSKVEMHCGAAIDRIINHAQATSDPPSQPMLDEAHLLIGKSWSSCFSSDKQASNVPFNLERMQAEFMSKERDWVMLGLPKIAGVQFVRHSEDMSIERAVTVYPNLTVNIQAEGRPVRLPTLQGIVINDSTDLMEVLQIVQTASTCPGIAENALSASKAPFASRTTSSRKLVAHATDCWSLHNNGAG